MIRKVLDSNGNVVAENLHPLDDYNNHAETIRALWSWNPTREQAVVAPEASYITAANMKEVTTRGTGKKASRELDFPTAGKTGTLPYDVWFVGWSPDYIGGVWVGSTGVTGSWVEARSGTKCTEGIQPSPSGFNG